MREEYIKSIINYLHKSKQETCCRISKIPGSSITPSEWAALSVIYSKEGINTKDIASKLGVTVSAASQILKNLEKNELVRRTIDPVDRRFSHISLSAKSKKTMKAMQEAINESFAEMFSVLSDEELKTLAKLHKKVSEGANK